MLQKTSHQFPKKAVLLKNCSIILNSKNDNSIKLPTGEEKPPEVPFNGLSLLAFQAQRKLSYWRFVLFYSSSIFLFCYPKFVVFVEKNNIENIIFKISNNTFFSLDVHRTPSNINRNMLWVIKI